MVHGCCRIVKAPTGIILPKGPGIRKKTLEKALEKAGKTRGLGALAAAL
jgi:hypothetical protein